MKKGVDLVLVTGATGKQGGAVAHELLDAGHRVRALTRHPDSAAAKELVMVTRGYRNQAWGGDRGR